MAFTVMDTTTLQARNYTTPGDVTGLRHHDRLGATNGTSLAVMDRQFLDEFGDLLCLRDPESSTMLRHVWRPDGEAYSAGRGLTAYYFSCYCGKRREVVRYTPAAKRHGAVDSERIFSPHEPMER